MWALNILPDWVFHIMLLIGVLGTVSGWILKKFPTVSLYALPIQVVGILLLIVSVWYEGGIAKDNEYRLKEATLEAKVKDAEARASDINANIQYVFIGRVETVKDVQYVIKEKIREVAPKIDQNCKVDPAAIELLNDAALNVKPGSLK